MASPFYLQRTKGGGGRVWKDRPRGEERDVGVTNCIFGGFSRASSSHFSTEKKKERGE